MTNTGTKRILEDLKLRGLELGGVIAVDSKTGKLVVITYDNLGLVTSISDGDKAIALYGKADVGTRAMREITTLSAVE